MQSLTGDVASSSYAGGSRTYTIRDGKIFTEMVGTPLDITVYKVGDKYLAARGNEFGYANYEMLAKGPPNLVTLKKGEYDKESQDSFLHTKE